MSGHYHLRDGIVNGARWVASPNCDQRPKGVVVDTLVIHCISLPPGCYGGTEIEEFFCNCLDVDRHQYFREICTLQVSAHFLIRRSGELLQFVRTGDRAWHAGQSRLGSRANVNDFSVGIELEGTDDTVFERTQYVTLVELSLLLCRSYPSIAMSRIVGHSDIAPGRKTDPGAGFDWSSYRQALEKCL